MILPNLAEACAHLKIDVGYDDEVVQRCLDTAINVASDFLGYNLRTVTSSSETDNTPSVDSVSQAILLLTENFYDNRTAGQGEILKPWSTEWMLLYPSRKVGV